MGVVYNHMRYTKFIAVGAMCALLPSCGLLQSALRTPGSIMKSVGRTTGFINYEGADKVEKTEAERQEEEEQKIY